MFKWFKHRKELNNEELIRVFQELIALLKNSDESLYSGMETKEIIKLMKQEIEKLKAGEKVNYKELKALFVPTGPIQEISIDNGWGDIFIALANRYDSATLFRS